jgi:hypothetical protein
MPFRPSLTLTVIVVLVALGVFCIAAWRPVSAALRRRRTARALRLFRLQREQLEAQFFVRAGARGKPRGARWLECDWQDSVTFGRDIQTGMLTAFVGVNIRFEAIEGGDMEGVEAVGMVRDAAALFHYHRGRWGTGGRALFNMNPSDALVRLKGQYEPIDLLAVATP